MPRGNADDDAAQGTGGTHRTPASLLFLLALAGCEATLVSGVDEAQANEVVAALAAAGIPSKKVAGGTTPGGAGTGAPEGGHRVEVAPADLPRGLRVLEAAALPRPASPSLSDVFSGGGLVPTPTEERARLASAYAGELARTLETLPGVRRARVHVALPDGSGLRLDDGADGGRHPVASVMLLVAPPSPADGSGGPAAEASALDDAGVARLVAGAVDGLEPESVAVVRVPGPPAPRPALTGAGSPPLVRVGPFRLAAESAPTFRVFLGAGLGLLLVAGGALVWTVRRGRRRVARLERELAELTARGAPGEGGGPFDPLSSPASSNRLVFDAPPTGSRSP
jgi:type III secretion protein J